VTSEHHKFEDGIDLSGCIGPNVFDFADQLKMLAHAKLVVEHVKLLAQAQVSTDIVDLSSHCVVV